MRDEDIIAFLQFLIETIKKKEIKNKEKELLEQFFVTYNIVSNDIHAVDDMKDFKRMLFLGWYVNQLLEKSKTN